MEPGGGGGGSSTQSYPSAARISDSLCYPQYTASLKCLEEFNSDKSKCQEHFDVYKECKKKEAVFAKELSLVEAIEMIGLNLL
ncbi:CHCH [Macleaya cordata]|uniref:CHCH n=1 Tax=Macleaya cordata TaxID=56857 RepID=A0A200Q8Q8_MACCD|nr:CHCH [Macleaya cordata]